MGEDAWPKKLREKKEKVFAFNAYFLKSRSKPGHVDQVVALEAIMNAIYYEAQRIDTETRHSIIGTSSKFPGKHIRLSYWMVLSPSTMPSSIEASGKRLGEEYDIRIHSGNGHSLYPV